MSVFLILLSIISLVMKVISVVYMVKNKFQRNLWLCYTIILLDALRIPFYLYESDVISALLGAFGALCWLVIYILYKKR